MINFSWKNFRLTFQDRTTAIGYEVKRPEHQTVVQINFPLKSPPETITLKSIEEALNLPNVQLFEWLSPIKCDISEDGTFYKYDDNPDRGINIPKQLTPKEKILYTLLKLNDALPKTILLQWFKTDTALQSHISRLRKKIKPLGENIKYRQKTYILENTGKN
ncbi:winged helix-turn-helix domain-containing protein [Candidatus Poribacteria bacterium]|nr:winged helix-turn-helix domain-containing protein [Candidatus Poribacteria bacterium]